MRSNHMTRQKIGIIALILLLLSGLNLHAQSLSGKKFCIDPGHGGNNPANDRYVVPDPGTDFWESESNFRKALHLEQLMKDQGAWVILTRYTNTYPNDADEPSLTSRWQLANANNVHWFHSIHSNATGWAINTTVNYTLILVKEDIATRQPAFPEAVTMGNIMGPAIRANLRNTNRSTWTYLDYTFYGGPNGGFNLGVLKGLLMPGELSEGSFHDNFAETRRLMNNSYRKMEAYALRNSFLQHFSAPADSRGIIAGIVTDVGTGRPLNYARVRIMPENRVYEGDRFYNGFYMFDSLEAGQKWVIFETPGYQKDSAQVTLATGATVFVDRNAVNTAAPAVVATSPAQGSQTVHPLSTLSFNFTKPMNTASVEAAFSITPSAPGAFAWNAQNSGFTYTPSAPLQFEVSYTAKIDTSAKAADGLSLDGNGDGTAGDPFILTFKTIYADIEAPAIVDAVPAANDTLRSSDAAIHIGMNEPLNPTSITTAAIALQEIGGSIRTLAFEYAQYGTKSGINVYPTVPLTPGKSYRIRIGGLKDLVGNTMPSTAVLYEFHVSPAVYNKTWLGAFNGSMEGWMNPDSHPYTFGVDPLNTSAEVRASKYGGVPGNTGSVLITYKWDTTASSHLLHFGLADGTPQKQEVFQKDSSRLSAYVYGDGSGTLFRFVINDSADSPSRSAFAKEVSQWTPITWVGWRLVEWYIDKEPAGTWIGDGTVNGSWSLEGVQLKYEAGSSLASGRVFVDEIIGAEKAVVSVNEPRNDAPTGFALGSNYPNPFNPTTRIPFIVGTAGKIHLAVYDLLGREIAVIADGIFQTGEYIAEWDGTTSEGMPATSGTYIYRLSAGSRVLSGKMVLMK